MELPKRLAGLVKRFAFEYDEHAQTGALVQLWVPQWTSGGRAVLTTQGTPFIIMGVSDQLALYRYCAGNYQPQVDKASAGSCPISRVFANLQLEQSAASSAASAEFDRAAEAQRCNIHSNLLLAVHDATKAQDNPVAVFELAQHEANLEFSTAVNILHNVAEECDFWIPTLESLQPGDASEASSPALHETLAAAAAAAAATAAARSPMRSRGRSPGGEASRVCRYSYMVAHLPVTQQATEPAQQQYRQGQRARRTSVVFTEHYKFEQVPPTAEAVPGAASMPPASAAAAAAAQAASSGMDASVTSWALASLRDHSSSTGVQPPPPQQQQQWVQGTRPGQPMVMASCQPHSAASSTLPVHVHWDAPVQLQARSSLRLQSSASLDRRGAMQQQQQGWQQAVPLAPPAPVSVASGNWSAFSTPRTSTEEVGPSQRVRVLLTLGGSFRRTGAAGGWVYEGGAQKVVAVPRRACMQELLSILSSKAQQGNVMQLKYALPGSDMYIDLDAEEDMQNMWEEWEEYAAKRSGTAVRLQLYMDTSSSSSDNEQQPGSAQLQPSTPTSGAAAAAAGSIRLSAVEDAASHQQSSKLGVCQLQDTTAGDNGCGDPFVDFDACVVLPFFDRSRSGHYGCQGRLPDGTPFSGAAGADAAVRPTAAGEGTDGDGEDSDEFATCLDLTLGEGDADVAAVLAAINREKQAGLPITGNIQQPAAGSTGTGSAGSAAAAAATGDTALNVTGSSELDGGLPADQQQLQQQQPKAGSLKQLVKQLKSQVEVIMPHELFVTRFVGGGAFGEVYLARWHGTDVAVKFLTPSLLLAHRSVGSSNDGSGSSSSRSAGPWKQAMQDLLQEASMLASMHHPNIVAVYGVVLPPSDAFSCSLVSCMGPDDAAGGQQLQQPGTGVMRCGGEVVGPAIVTEFLSAGSMQGAIRSNAEWLKSSMAKIKVMLDTARGIDYLHSKGLVHFDLKSANILVTIKDRVPCAKVADFGLAKQRRDTYVTGVDSMRGTLPWIAPEIIRSPANVTEKADIYSLGVCMWELWSCQEPFEGVQIHALLHQLTVAGGLKLAVPGSADWQSESDEPAPAEPAPGWSELMQRCWSAEPQNRPSSRQLVCALEGIMSHLQQARRKV